MLFEVLIEIRHHEGLADPEGATITRALKALGFGAVRSVRVGKALRLSVEAASAEEARSQAEAMCKRLLVNPIVESARIEVLEGQADPAKSAQR
jgi:phosphoribosylformylglycinamidine synthase PurS subunit